MTVAKQLEAALTALSSQLGCDWLHLSASMSVEEIARIRVLSRGCADELAAFNSSLRMLRPTPAIIFLG